MITRTFTARRDTRMTFVVHTFGQEALTSIFTKLSNTNVKATEVDRFQLPTFMLPQLTAIVAEMEG